jgi:hypothetical protein
MEDSSAEWSLQMGEWLNFICGERGVQMAWFDGFLGFLLLLQAVHLVDPPQTHVKPSLPTLCITKEQMGMRRHSSIASAGPEVCNAASSWFGEGGGREVTLFSGNNPSRYIRQQTEAQTRDALDSILGVRVAPETHVQHTVARPVA